MSDRLGPDERRAAVDALRSTSLDILVIGGGVVGCGAALDAAARGLSVGLVEQSDLAAGTSSRSSRLAHGGLRYLEQREFHLVREALTERGLLLDRLAPHLVRPIPFLFPVSHRWERPYVASGVRLYDLLSKVGAYGGTMPRPKSLNREEAKALAPDLDSGEIAGAVRFHDAQIDDARHTVAVARTAAALGAHIVTRTRVESLILEEGTVVGARVHDDVTGDSYDIRARIVIAAVGIWTDEILRMAGQEGEPRVRQSKGVHLVVPGSAIRSTTAIIARTPTSVLFLLPWAGKWLVGTTDTPAEDVDLANPRATEEDVDYLLAQANRWLARPLTRADVLSTYAGFRPLIAEGDDDDPTATLSREHALFRPCPGLVAIAGGKYTTYRVMAADAVDAAVEQCEGEIPESSTSEIPLIGAEGFAEDWQRRSAIAEDAGLSLEMTERLLRRHGARISEVLALIDADPSLREPLIPGEPYLRAEVVLAASHQGALGLGDVLDRRLRIGLETADGGLAAAEAALPLVAGVLDWDAARSAEEWEAYAVAASDRIHPLGDPVLAD